MNLAGWFFGTGVSLRSFRVWQRNRDVFLRLWKTEVGPFIAEPLFILTAMGFGLGAYVGSVNGRGYIEFLAPGIVAAYTMFSASFECTYGSFVRMKHQKTYDAITATPVNIEDVITGEILWGATRSLMTGLALLLVIAAFGLIRSPWALLLPVVGLANGLLFASISMMATAVTPSVYAFNYYFTLFITPMFFFSGVFFPLDQLPRVVQALTWVLPLTPAVHLLRGLFFGQPSPLLLADLALMVAVGLFFFAFSLRQMRRRLIQ